MAKPPLTLICNPVSGRGAGARRMAYVERLLRSEYLEFQSRTTEGPGHASQLAREAADSGSPLVVACGGDGTISQVANGIQGTDAALGLIPLGTGNDLARHFGLSRIEDAVAALVRNECHPVDLVAWKNAGASGRFINIAGCGFDALVAERVNQGFRTLRGTSAYIVAVVATLAHYRPALIEMEIDGECIRSRAMLCAFANASSYGGGMRIAPEADASDGLIDCVLIGDVSRSEFLRTFPKVFRGAHLDHPAVSVYRGKAIRVGSEPPLPFLCDGELAGFAPVIMELERAAITVVY